jgi:hypothetical protein
MNRRLPLRIALALAAVVFAAGTAHAQVNCCALPNTTVTGNVNDEVFAVGCGCTIDRSAFVNGNVSQTGDGSLTVRGAVNGGVSEAGLGNLVIDRGIVGGDCAESESGHLIVRPDSSVNGKLYEAGSGRVDVIVGAGGPAKGDIEESGPGPVYVTTLTGAYEGSIVEQDGGDVDVTVTPGTAFKGGVIESGIGSALSSIEGVFEGNIVELGSGNLVTDGNGQFKGNTEHEAPGFCLNTIEWFEGSACVPL